MTTSVRTRTGREGGSARIVERLAGYAAGTLLIIALGVWAVWMAVAETPEVEGILQRTTVHSDHAVTVYFEVAKDRQSRASCTIRALDRSGATVGSESVTVPAATERAWLSHRLATTGPAASTQVVDCHLVEPG